MSACRTCIGLDCDDGPALGTYSLQRVILPEVTSTSGEISVAAFASSYGCLDSPFSANIIATGRLANSGTQWSVIGGSLPTGLTLVGHGNYATLSGTPSAGGIYRFTVLAEASNGDVSARQITFPVYQSWVSTACGSQASGTVSNLVFPNSGSNIVYCSSTERVYHSDAFASNTVRAINLLTGAIEATISVGVQPTAICYAEDNDRVYVANELDGTCSVIDPSINAVVATVTLSGVARPMHGAASGNGKVYITDKNGGSVYVLSTQPIPTLLSTISTSVQPIRIAYSSSDKFFYATATGGMVLKLNAQTDTETSSFLADTRDPGDSLTGLCIKSATGNRLFVTAGDADNITPTLVRISDADVVVGETNGTLDHNWTRVAYCPTNDRIYVTDFEYDTGDGFVLIFNPSTGALENTLTLAAASYPWDVIYVPNIDKMAVTTANGISFIAP